MAQYNTLNIFKQLELAAKGKNENPIELDDSWDSVSESEEPELETESEVLEAAGGQALPKGNEASGSTDSSERDQMDFKSDLFQIKAQKILVRDIHKNLWIPPTDIQEKFIIKKLCTSIGQYEHVKLLTCCNYESHLTNYNTTKPNATNGNEPIPERICSCNPWKRTAARYLQIVFLSQHLPALDKLGQPTVQLKQLLTMMLRCCRPPRLAEVEPRTNESSQLSFILSPEVVQTISCLYKAACGNVPKDQLQKLTDEFINGTKIELPINIRQTMHEIFFWYLDNKTKNPRFRSYCSRRCGENRITVRVAVSEPSYLTDNLCFRSYRMYLLTHMVVNSLARGGYHISYTTQRPNPENAYTIAIQDMSSKDNAPYILKVGEVESPDVSAEYLDIFRDSMTQPPPGARAPPPSTPKKKRNKGKVPKKQKYYEALKTLIMPVFSLQNVTFNYDLLGRPAEAMFHMNLPSNGPNQGQANQRGLYGTFNKIFKLLQDYRARDQQKIYGEQFDYRSTLWHPNTPVLPIETQIIQMLFEWPAVVANTIDVVRKCESIQNTLNYMKAFDALVQSYYLNNQILLDPASVNKPRLMKMYDQICLVKVIVNVYLEFFELIVLNQYMSNVHAFYNLSPLEWFSRSKTINAVPQNPGPPQQN